VIWKRVAGRTLTPEIARQLLADGKTREVLSGFRSRAGKPFRARLILKEDGKVEFDFPVSRKRQGEQDEESQEQREEQPAAAPGAD
jgi:DNA topoisomerase III